MIKIPKTSIENIKKVRIKKGLTQKYVSNVSNFSRSYISLLENKHKNITLKTLKIILNAENICCKDLCLCKCTSNCTNENREILLKLNLKEIRLKHNLSKKKLSKMSGVSRSYINLLEKDKKNPTLKTLKLLTAALNVKLEELIIFECTNHVECKKHSVPTHGTPKGHT